MKDLPSFPFPSKHTLGEGIHLLFAIYDIHVLQSLISSCRDEIDHLVEVLNSREIVVSNVEQGNRHTNLTSQQDDEGLAMTHRLPKVSSERRHEESNGAIWGSSTPLGLSKVSIASTCFNH